MRLTLRTLLAHLDGILDPDDSQDIGKKVEESEYATGLVQRIRDVVRRLRLPAPSPTERGAELDANTVAEYLDNTLPSDAVTDFEKICLESDIHLAEVASCHQILTLVLGEPAEIDPASRQKMYELKDEPAAKDVSPDKGMAATYEILGDKDRAVKPPVLPAGDTSPPPLVNTVTTLDLGGNGGVAYRRPRAKPTVPEYLRDARRKRRWIPVAAAVVLLACFGVVVLMALGQFEPETPLGNMLAQCGIVSSSPPHDLANANEEPSPIQGKEPDTAEPEKAVEQGPAVPTVEAAAAEAGNAPEQKPVDEATKEAMKEPGQATEPAPALAIQPPAEPVTPPIAEPVKEPTTDIVIKAPDKPSTPETPAPSKAAILPSAKEPGEAASKVAPETAKSDAPDKEPGAEPPPLPPEPMGRLVSSDQVLLKDDGDDGWTRVAPGQMLLPARFLALPTYRPKVALTAGISLEILGGTQIEMLPSDMQNPAGLRVLYGRIAVMSIAQPKLRLRVLFGDRSGTITFDGAESVAAIEVRRVRAPGTNPEADPPHIVANLFAGAGGIQWDEGNAGQDAKAVQLTAPQWVSFNGGLTSAPATSKELPVWLTGEPISQIETRASVSIAQLHALPTDRLARLALLELRASRPQKEVRWLALRCLGYIGQYQDMVKALDDPARRLDWPEYVEELRSAVARDSQSAATVRLALEKQYPQHAAALYRMLWGYSDKDLEGGDDERLVKGLEDDTLAVRVLSFWNLKEVTGFGLFYRPEQTDAKRQQPLLQWRRRLEVEQIRLTTPAEKAGAANVENIAPPPAEPGR